MGRDRPVRPGASRGKPEPHRPAVQGQVEHPSKQEPETGLANPKNDAENIAGEIEATKLKPDWPLIKAWYVTHPLASFRVTARRYDVSESTLDKKPRAENRPGSQASPIDLLSIYRIAADHPERQILTSSPDHTPPPWPAAKVLSSGAWLGWAPIDNPGVLDRRIRTGPPKSRGDH
jgi:hypothetical protein